MPYRSNLKFEYSSELVLGCSVTAVALETLLVLVSLRVNYFCKVTTLIVVTSSSMGFMCDHSWTFIQFFIYLFCLNATIIYSLCTDSYLFVNLQSHI